MTTVAPTQPARIPVTVLTGFLGAGKTTVLNHILRTGGRRFAVLVNDFGSVNIDADLIVAVEGERISLAGGCICSGTPWPPCHPRVSARRASSP